MKNIIEYQELEKKKINLSLNIKDLKVQINELNLQLEEFNKERDSIINRQFKIIENSKNGG